MISSHCETIREKLVEFADGELPARGMAAVADHVAECAECRQRLAALRRSLALAQTVWHDADSQLASIEAPGPIRMLPRNWRGVALVAASVALFAAGGLYFEMQRGDLPSAPPAKVADAGDDLAPIKLRIAREGVASQLLAAANLLAEQPGGEDIACERYHYVAAAYPETRAATECEARLSALCEGRNGT